MARAARSNNMLVLGTSGDGMMSRNQPPNDSEAAFGHFGARQHRNNQIKFFTIAEVAERLHVATRTVRRWIEAGDLVAHKIGAVIRIGDDDLRAFLALHRES
jgi:excisionase family DNA binding protein